MKFVTTVNKRRSIRKFSNTIISDTIIKDLLATSIKAPSGKNRQPWRFVVIQGNAKKELVAAVALGYSDQHPYPRPRKSWQEVTKWRK